MYLLDLLVVCLLIVSSSALINKLQTKRPIKLYSSSLANTPPVISQREYYIAVRNRLFAVEEQIWLHEYAISHPTSSKVKPLSEKKYNEFIKSRGELLEEYPLTKLYADLYDAQKNNLTYAAAYLERVIESFHRQLPLSLEHNNLVAVLSSSGQVMNLMRGQGLVHQRLLPSNTMAEKGVRRQFQHPVFSRKGKYLSFAEIHFKESTILRSNLIVYNVPNDPKAFGTSDVSPIFDSGELPTIPFFVQFSPDEETIAFLSSKPPGSNDTSTSLMTIDWGRFHRKDSWAGQAAVSRFNPRKVVTLLRGSPLFFSYTTSSSTNATIVAHCQRDASTEGSGNIEKGVYILQRSDTAGVNDFSWKLLSHSDASVKWPTPICHSAGGGDNVLVVEDGWIVSKAISRWKRDSSGQLASKKILQVKGQTQFLVSPDNSRAVILQEDINIGHYALTVVEGEAALDPLSPSTGKQFEMPFNKVALAFFFSPDSTKLLCLTISGSSIDDMRAAKSRFQVSMNSDLTWIVYNFPLNEWKEYDTFKTTPYFYKTYLPFFSQYAQAFNPWAPDSRSFLFVTSSGLNHTPLVGSKYCVGTDKWVNQGATLGTWFRH